MHLSAVDRGMSGLSTSGAVAAGTFGRVLECWDRKVKDYVAVKIVRNVDKYRHAAMIEVRGIGLL